MERYNRKRGNMKLAGMLLKNSIPVYFIMNFVGLYFKISYNGELKWVQNLCHQLFRIY